MMQWSKRKVDFVKVKFHLNENIEWQLYATWIEFKILNNENSNSSEFIFKFTIELNMWNSIGKKKKKKRSYN